MTQPRSAFSVAWVDYSWGFWLCLKDSWTDFFLVINFVFSSLFQSEHFAFLGNGIAVSEMRCRSMFYTSLGRLLMVELGEDEDRFDVFMLPLTGEFLFVNRITLMLSNWSSSDILFNRSKIRILFCGFSGSFCRHQQLPVQCRGKWHYQCLIWWRQRVHQSHQHSN